MIPGYAISLDFIGVDDPWIGVDPDMDVLRRIVCETFLTLNGQTRYL
jgi:hypothetical protein